MRFIEDLCPPALLYLIFLVVQLGLDASLGMWVTLVVKALLGGATVLLLDTLCGVGLSPVSWFLVATPFIVTALATAIAMGTNFDVTVMQQLNLTEKFEQKDDDEADIPVSKSSNSVERQAQNGTLWGRK
jgi:hypothetical protein